MKVQLLGFPGCPNLDAARELLRRGLRQVGARARFEEIDVSASDTPEALRVWGSPTILVDGRDVAGDPPTGASCRLYHSEGARGVPPEALVVAALRSARAHRRSFSRSLATLPGAFVALLPSVTCAACLPAYVGLLSSLGLGFLARESVLAPLIAAFLMLGVASVAWSTRGHRRFEPLLLTLLGSAAIALGRIFWNVPAAVYIGLVLVVGASVWNLWLKRPRPQPLVTSMT